MTIAGYRFLNLATAGIVVCALTHTSARAENADAVTARIQSLEKEIAAIKKENEALRQIKRLREENASLVTHRPANPDPVIPQQRLPTLDPREAYAADVPLYAKAAAPVERGQLKIWAEGGATWSGGDPIYSFYDRPFFVAPAPNTGIVPELFSLKPKAGWEAASGFDYRFTNSAWHISGQFRYGEGRTSAGAGSATSVTLPPVTYNLSDAANVIHKETRWLADLAVGRDVIGNGPDAMQLKFGVRVAEFRTVSTGVNHDVLSISNVPAFISNTVNVAEDNRFLGAGPRLGIDGSVPMGRGWTFEYLGDLAVLFGTQKFQRTTHQELLPLGISDPTTTFDSTQRFATVFNPDIQFGLSYWVTDAMKVSASYRLDAYFNVLNTLDAKNDPGRLRTMDRYTHGPRLAVSTRF